MNDKELYENLGSEDAQLDDINWMEIYNESGMLLEYRESAERIEYTFLSNNFEVNTIATIELTAVDEGWKVTRQEFLSD